MEVFWKNFIQKLKILYYLNSKNTLKFINNFFSHFQCIELPDSVPSFIESCLQYLRSQWREIQLQAIQHIGLLHHFGTISTEDNYRIELETTTSDKIISCLKDEQIAVKLKAAEALGNIFSSENP